MSGLLGSIFSFGDDLKKRARGLLHDPLGYANATVGEFNDKAQHAARGLLAGKGGMESVDALGAGPHALGGLLGAIKVFHGSPHVFDKADSSKIGTGEGAQAYGHGLYFAENQNVAKQYAGMNPASSTRIVRNGDKYDVLMVRDSGPLVEVGTFADRAAAEQAAGKAQQSAANLYEANLRWPDAAREAKDPLGPQHFLDWDKPLAEQSPSVLDALAKSGVQYGPLKQNARIADPSVNGPLSGATIYNDTARALVPDGARDMWRGSTPVTGQGQRVSEHMRQLGIPGIAYMDAGSRAAGQGTRNYVTFDDALVELLSRNGLPLKQEAPQGLLGKIADMPKRPEYQGQHGAPMRDSGSPLHDLAGAGKIYPDDFYGPNGMRYYGTGSHLDAESMDIISRFRNKPNANVTIYRAVPYEKTPHEKAQDLEKQLQKYMARGIYPDGVGDVGKWYERTKAQAEKLRAQPEAPPQKLGINRGDWVTINRGYAVEHGEANLGGKGKYKIIKQTVPARSIYTNGDSLHEFGYDPDPLLGPR
jgi:hypothetical protein